MKRLWIALAVIGGIYFLYKSIGSKLQESPEAVDSAELREDSPQKPLEVKSLPRSTVPAVISSSTDSTENKESAAISDEDPPSDESEVLDENSPDPTIVDIKDRRSVRSGMSAMRKIQMAACAAESIPGWTSGILFPDDFTTELNTKFNERFSVESNVARPRLSAEIYACQPPPIDQRAFIDIRWKIDLSADQLTGENSLRMWGYNAQGEIISRSRSSIPNGTYRRQRLSLKIPMDRNLKYVFMGLRYFGPGKVSAQNIELDTVLSKNQPPVK